MHWAGDHVTAMCHREDTLCCHEIAIMGAGRYAIIAALGGWGTNQNKCASYSLHRPSRIHLAPGDGSERTCCSPPCGGSPTLSQ